MNKKRNYRFTKISKTAIIVVGIIFSCLLFVHHDFAATSPWSQSNWSGGSGQLNWSDATKFLSASGLTTTSNIQVTLSWYNSSWLYRKKVTFDNSAQAENLANFPVLIKLTSSNFDFSKAQSAGQDIRFTDSDGVTSLNYEIEKWDNSGSLAWIWVKVPQIDSSSSSDSIYMYYGNNSATDTQAVTSVWSNGYAAVYHLKETGNGTAGEYKDALNINNGQGGGGTGSRVPTLTASGQIDGAQTFTSASSKYISIPDNSTLNITGDLTIELWTKPSLINSTTQIIFEKGDGTTNANRQYAFRLSSANQWNFFLYTGSTANNRNDTTTTPSTSRYDYLVGTRSGNTITLNTNGGSSISSGTVAGSTNSSTSILGIGRSGALSSAYYNGDIDEVRISNVARSAAWIAASYKSGKDTFNSYGTEQNASSGTTGTLTSSIFDTETSSDFGILTYSVTTPSNTSAEVYVRTGNSPTLTDATAFGSCTSIASGQSVSGNSCVNNSNRYVQYEIILTSSDSVSTPTFNSISIAFAPTAAPNSTGFVQRLGNKLYLNGSEFKFSGNNIYWIGLTDAPTTASPITIPSGATQGTQTNARVDHPPLNEVDDALATAKEMGQNVIRSHALIQVGCSICIEPSLGTFNDSAFDSVDYAIQQAGVYNLKMIFPLTDSFWYYTGGNHTFTDWESLPESSFYNNSTVIADFKAYISHVLNHVNAYTGVAYKNDPTILAWETGNDSNGGATWEQTIATYIKSIDSNHLVADGSTSIITANLQNSAVDMFSTHFYPTNTTNLNADANLTTSYNKVYFVGEYDWSNAGGSGDPLTNFLSAVESGPAAGDLFWTLWSHNSTYGFVSKGATYALNYVGNNSDMQTRASQLRTHAYTMRSLSTPAAGTSATPLLHLPTETTTGINIWWRGGAGASTYNLQRSPGLGANWTTVATGLTDNSTPYIDTTAFSGTNYCYRVQPVNLDNVAGSFSNAQSLGNEIQNGSFEYSSFNNSLAFWTMVVNSAAASSASLDTTASSDGTSSVKIVTTVSDGTDFHVQFRQNLLPIILGHSYAISFSAKASASRTILATLQKSSSPFNVYSNLPTSNLTTSWQNFSSNFTASASDTTPYLNFNLGVTTGTVWIDNVILTDTTAGYAPISSCSDSVAPTGGSIDYTNGYYTTASVALTVDDGTDSGSGINTSSRTIQRKSATLSIGSCGSYGSFSTISPTGSYPDFTDSTVLSGNCYQYQYLISDNDSNQSIYQSSNISKIDLSVPTAPGTPSTTTPTNSTTQTWNWTASGDTESAVVSYAWRTTGTQVLSGVTATNSVATNLTQGTYTFFVKALNNAGLYGSESSAVLTVDTTAPTGTVVINNADIYTTNTNITLTLDANDNLSSVSQMIISEDSNFTGAVYESFSSSKSFTLSSTNGIKTIYVRFKDSLENQSTTFSDSITLDNNPPTGGIIINGGASKTTSRNVTLVINAADNISDIDKMQISEDSNFNGVIWEDFTTSKSFILSENNGIKTIYVKFKDIVGNISNSYYDDIQKVDKATVSETTGGSSESTGSTTTTVVIPIENNSEYIIIKLVDESGKPLAGAKVVIAELGLKALTDINGLLNLGIIAPKNYTAVIEYNNKVITKILGVEKNNQIITIKLSPNKDTVNIEGNVVPEDDNSTILIVAALVLGGASLFVIIKLVRRKRL